MPYIVKEIFYTLQGEGAHAGRPAVFVRFAGCNLWSGREEDRAIGAGGCARWCDTNFLGTDGPGGGRYPDAAAVADAVRSRWPVDAAAAPFTVLTGGEPTLQVDGALVVALRGLHGHAEWFGSVAVETNGTRPLPDPAPWVTLSPKPG